MISRMLRASMLDAHVYEEVESDSSAIVQAVLIVVVVAMDTVSQVQTRLMSQQYASLIKKTKFGR